MSRLSEAFSPNVVCSRRIRTARGLAPTLSAFRQPSLRNFNLFTLLQDTDTLTYSR